MSSEPKKLWGGRFTQSTDAFVEAFTSSIAYDSRLYRHDILASKIHCQMLGRQGIIAVQDVVEIINGLDLVLGELTEGTLPFDDSLEDIHMHVESRLKELIGPVAGKLHTARSRNDQVATDIRLYLRDEVDAMGLAIREVQQNLLNLAKEHVETILPGFTHLQNAQPISFAHHLLAYFEMFDRDFARLVDLRKRLNQLPLGSAALAGTPFPVDREWVATQLGFEGICQNSIDGVSDRDFAVELASAAALIMTHFSRFSEELIFWSSPAFGFVELSDAFCTGSSIMPQKKNPDIPELVRGKTGRVVGNLMALLTLMKGLPLAYNRDMQEDKEPIFDTIDTVLGVLRVFRDLIPGISVKKAAMLAAAGEGFTTATDLADYLVKKNIPFREAHAISGRIVKICVDSDKTLDELTLEKMQEVDSRIEADVAKVLTVQASVNARVSLGGTAFETVKKALISAENRINNNN
ncbi:MAG: argininosuccinate lyase [Magnetococcales bacterium]|nr:argininosuccinate lyase [Magnetococcales bacterium]